MQYEIRNRVAVDVLNVAPSVRFCRSTRAKGHRRAGSTVVASKVAVDKIATGITPLFLVLIEFGSLPGLISRATTYGRWNLCETNIRLMGVTRKIWIGKSVIPPR